MNIKKKINGDKALVRVDGRVDMNNAKILLDKLSPLVFSCNEIVLDIEGMQYISSAGLRVFLGVYKDMKRKHGSFKLININDAVMDILRLTGFDIVFGCDLIGQQSSVPSELLGKLKEKGQEHLLRFYDELDEQGKQKLAAQIDELDLSVLDMTDEEVERGHFEPLGALTIDQINEDRQRFTDIGLDAIRKGQVGAVLLAGGQGSRLGSDKPKGMFNIGINRELYIFECLINEMMKVVKQAGAFIPLFVMTSKLNDKDTREFFEQKGYFGYNRAYVHFFVQEQLPAVDMSGKLMLSAMDTVACAPNGNGGWYISMRNSGVLHESDDTKNIKWLNVFAVDNVLQKIADPCFIGAVIDSAAACGAKVVSKASPDEKVGVLCLEDGKPSVAEYYEMTEEMRTRREPDGTLSYRFGVILNYLFKADELDKAFGITLPLHRAFKQVNYIDEYGRLIRPEKPNAYKYETLVLDMIRLQSSCLAFEVERDKEFAPVKNKTGIDSVESARELLKKNGVEL